MTLLDDTVYSPDSVLLEIMAELVVMKRHFTSLKGVFNRDGNVISQVCLFLLIHITHDVDLSYLCHSALEFLILDLAWTNEFHCGIAIPYLTY